MNKAPLIVIKTAKNRRTKNENEIYNKNCLSYELIKNLCQY